ncbi:hypothetical protein AAC387_Pa07g1478 [Persea americana]
MSFDYDFFLLLLPSAVEDRTEIWGKNWGLSGVSLAPDLVGLRFLPLRFPRKEDLNWFWMGEFVDDAGFLEALCEGFMDFLDLAMDYGSSLKA